eukprot:1452809-Alexandrium_andersonii.AAC.1
MCIPCRAQECRARAVWECADQLRAERLLCAKCLGGPSHAFVTLECSCRPGLLAEVARRA